LKYNLLKENFDLHFTEDQFLKDLCQLFIIVLSYIFVEIKSI